MSPSLRFALPAALLALAGGVHPAFAQVTQDYSTGFTNPFYVPLTSFTTVTGANSPTFNRPGISLGKITTPPLGPSGIGTAVGYAAQSFTPAEDAQYRITDTLNSGFNPTSTSSNFVQLLNVGSFDPADTTYANTGLVYNPPGSVGSYEVNLASGQAYTFVNAGRYNAVDTNPAHNSLGSVTTQIDKLNPGTTKNIPDNMPIGGNVPGSVSQTLSVSGAQTISAFNTITIFGLQHAYIGDLLGTLTHNGLTVDIFDHTGADNNPDPNDPNNNLGQGSGAAFDFGNTYTFAPEGASLADAVAGAPLGSVVDGGVYKATGNTATNYLQDPANPGKTLAFDPANSANTLSMFNGMDVSGDWTLKLTDYQTDNTGSFTGFKFNITPAAVPEASSILSFGLLLLLSTGSVILYARRKTAAH